MAFRGHALIHRNWTPCGVALTCTWCRVGGATGSAMYLYEDNNRSDYNLSLRDGAELQRGPQLTTVAYPASRIMPRQPRRNQTFRGLHCSCGEFSKAKISAFHGCHHFSGKVIRERRTPKVVMSLLSLHVLNDVEMCLFCGAMGNGDDSSPPGSKHPRLHAGPMIG